MERTIGDPGEFLNNSFATRAVNIAPDMARVGRLDIYHRRYRRLLRGWGLAGLALLGLGIGLWQTGHPVWGGLLGAAALPVLLIASRFRQTLRGDAYRNGLLIPGIISNLSPLTLTCVADVRNSDEETPPGGVVWGVQEVIIEQLTVQPERLGEQVPCVSLFGESSATDSYYLHFEPRPLAWGTDDARLIQEARQAIDEEEWKLLSRLAAAYAGSEKNTDGVAYFDADLQPVAQPAPAA